MDGSLRDYMVNIVQSTQSVGDVVYLDTNCSADPLSLCGNTSQRSKGCQNCSVFDLFFKDRLHYIYSKWVLHDEYS